MLEHVLLLAGLLLVAGLTASLFAGRLRVPALVVFLLLGMVAGKDGLEVVQIHDVTLIRDIGLVALVLILFEGGLASGIREIRPVIVPATLLATLGVLITAAVVGAVASPILHLSFQQGILLGAVVASTDGAAIFALLRGSTLRRRLARTLEGEAGMNDPVTALLVIGLIALQQEPGYTVLDIAVHMVQELAIDAVVGTAIGLAAVWLLRRARLASEGLYPVASLATAILAYAAASNLHGSGLLAAYLAGLMLGSYPVLGKRSITAFHDGIAWVAQLGMFLALGLLVSPHDLGDVWAKALVITGALLLARPVAVFTLLTPLRFTRPEKVAISWAGLRGAVPIVFATFPVIAHVPRAREFLAIVFFVVLLTTVVQGVSFEGLANRLQVTTTRPAIDRPLVEVMAVRQLGAEVVEVRVGDDDAIVGARVKDLGLPRDALLNVLVRGDQVLLPRGSTRLQQGDRLHLMARREVAHRLPALIERWRIGPIGVPARPARRHIAIAPIFRTGPWDPADGDAAEPTTVGGVAIVERLRLRRDGAGALVVLEDGRYAVSGRVMSLGSRRAVQRYARRRLEQSVDDAEAGWWQEVIGACGA